MSKKLKLTTKDICDALGTKKHKLRGWTENLPPYCDDDLTARVARKYTVRDLLFFATVKALEEDYGVGINNISKWTRELHGLLGKPLSNLHGQLLIFAATGEVSFAAHGTPAAAGIILEFEPIRQPIESYLDLSEPEQQRALPLGLIGVK